jgi:hypothetical protein
VAAGINATDTVQERLTKVLPADVTAAFISADQAFKAAFGDPFAAAGPIFWSFAAILLLCPIYFRFVTGIKNYLHVAFLCASFVVFAFAIASTSFENYFGGFLPDAVTDLVQPIAIGLPILWAFIISNIFVHWIGDRIAEPTPVPPPAPAPIPAPSPPTPGPGG